MHPLSPIAVAQQQLVTALETVPNLRVHDLGQSISPPACVLAPPRLIWSGYGGVANQPTTCQWTVYLVMVINQYAIDRLLDMVADVTAAIEMYTPGVVLSAGPDAYSSTAGPLPAYSIIVQSEVRTL